MRGGDPIYHAPAPLIDEQFYEIAGYYPGEEDPEE